MELRDIEYFSVIAEHGNMRRAAEALGLTPPALSKSLRRLEHAMEAKLVERTGRGVLLTPFGSALALQARRLRLTLEDITREAADLNRGHAGRLRIGAGPTDCEDLPQACTQLLRDAPKLGIDILVSDNDELVALMLDGKLDFSINTIPPTPYPGIEQERLYDDGYVAFASIEHPVTKKRRLQIADLVGELWASSTADYRPKQLLVQAFAERGLPEPTFAVQARSVRLRMQLVAASRILGFGTKRAVNMAARPYRLCTLPVKELTLPRRVGVMYRQGAYLPPAGRRLLELLRGMPRR
jgi:DNA-binding transcriptional LysR family regulator